MENELIESKAQMSFHLDGESEIDASLLAHMISDMVEYTKVVAQEVNPDAYLKMNVTAFKNGSFQVDFSAVCQVAQTIFTGVGVAATTAGTVIGAVKGGIEIKKLLKGEKPKKVSKVDDNLVEIEAKSGDKVRVPSASQVVVYNIQADRFLSSLSSHAREHNPNGGFTVSDDAGTIYCSADEVRGMTCPAPIVETTTCQRTVVKADMLIRKAIFEGTSKWGFDFNGKAIEAAIDDPDFWDWFQENGTVNRGDHLQVDLEVLVDLDPNGHPIKGTEKYMVIKVYGHILHNMEQIEI